ATRGIRTTSPRIPSTNLTSRGEMRNLRPSGFWERRGSNGTHTTASRVRAAGGGALDRQATGDSPRRAPRAAGRGRVFARRLPQARRRRERRASVAAGRAPPDPETGRDL